MNSQNGRFQEFLIWVKMNFFLVL